MSLSRDKRTKISCSICCIGLLTVVIWAGIIWGMDEAMLNYEDNENVGMNLTDVTGSIVVWGSGQASITQRFYFELYPSSSYYGGYILQGIWWETNERVLPGSTKATLYINSQGSTNQQGSTYSQYYQIDTSRNPIAVVVSDGKEINVNNLGFSGSSTIYWCLEVSYNTENMIMFYDDGRTLPEGQTLPGTLVGDLKTQFVFFPPTFSKDADWSANYTYDIILANSTVPVTQFDSVNLNISQTFINNTANFTWVDHSEDNFAEKGFFVQNVMDSSGTWYNNCFSVIVNNSDVYHTYSETDNYISFDINGTALNITGPMEHPNQSFNTGLSYLSVESQLMLIFLVGLPVTILVAVLAPALYVKAVSGVQRVRERAKLEKERKTILARLTAKEFVVPKKSRENLVYLRALEETIYSDHFQELFQRAEITREDLMIDQNQDGKIDEQDIAVVIENHTRKIFEQDILDELAKGGLME